MFKFVGLFWKKSLQKSGLFCRCNRLYYTIIYIKPCHREPRDPQEISAMRSGKCFGLLRFSRSGVLFGFRTWWNLTMTRTVEMCWAIFKLFYSKTRIDTRSSGAHKASHKAWRHDAPSTCGRRSSAQRIYFFLFLLSLLDEAKSRKLMRRGADTLSPLHKITPSLPHLFELSLIDFWNILPTIWANSNEETQF